MVEYVQRAGETLLAWDTIQGMAASNPSSISIIATLGRKVFYVPALGCWDLQSNVNTKILTCPPRAVEYRSTSG